MKNFKLLVIRYFTITALIANSSLTLAQLDSIIVMDQVRMMKDSLSRLQFKLALKGFLNEAIMANKINHFVEKQQVLASKVLMDEMKDITKSKKHNSDDFYRPYLCNLTRIKDSTYALQIAFMAMKESSPLLKASFNFMAQKERGQYYFYSPLKKNTSQWKMKQFGNTQVFYKNKLDRKLAKKYFDQVSAYDQKLGSERLSNTYYSADDFPEALQIAGISYKLDYNGYAHNEMTSRIGDSVITVSGMYGSTFSEFDPHDLWHERLHLVISTDSINRPVDEGTAYLYGGSWGLSWEEILKRFKDFAVANPNANWVELYNNGKNFDEKAKFPLQVDYAINALIARELEREKGFIAVLQLLSCGKKEKDNANYFIALEKIAGIKKQDFQAKVNGLLVQ